ncbi:MAG: hypothetical protein CVU42_04495 [Chloroflexi bacterium HGW-Chloroflexi-4]|jgi:uncharacterized protein YndB with AHSA1/START domain|nr:MAG: hypothetical protein CVU42_04495 [Chloroflexi bacterium HGW-Chloroflexi-4]
MDSPIRFNVLISASIEEVWTAWTTEEGAKTFFAPDCRIDFQLGGVYEMLYDLTAPIGQRGGEGCLIWP